MAAQPELSASVRGPRPQSKWYKWIVLSNTTLGMLMAMINSSILLISLPAIFRGIHINPLGSGESGYLLWILLGYMVVTATLLVTFGRISDMVGRRFALWDGKTPLKRAADAAFELIAKGLAPNSD